MGAINSKKPSQEKSDTFVDPRSPSTIRTPVHNKAEVGDYDPRSPNLRRTPIMAMGKMYEDIEYEDSPYQTPKERNENTRPSNSKHRNSKLDPSTNVIKKPIFDSPAQPSDEEAKVLTAMVDALDINDF